MSSKVLFEKDADSVEVNGPRGDQPYTPMARHVTGLSQAADRYVYGTNENNLRSWTLTLDELTDQQQQALDWFFVEVVNGPSDLFDYTDTDGVVREVRFSNVTLPWSRRGPNQWSVVITLEFEEDPANPSSS